MKKSAIDTSLLLTSEVEQNKRIGRKTTALFLDFKGAFDHVSKNRLLSIVKKLLLLVNLIAWVASFLNKRLIKLSFDGQSEEFHSINVGIPQGNPISPILFLIYIRDLFHISTVKFLSYIDDISLIVSSPATKKNIRILESAAKQLYDLGAENTIEFDLEKTELMHFTTSHTATDNPIKLPNQEIVHPQIINQMARNLVRRRTQLQATHQHPKCPSQSHIS